ncbi:asparaginase [Holdemanella sp.]|uniref:asparaginase n=1 Tax=Holdemanella sp. TaxID=1971762 RepID=UPI003AF0CBE2
MQCGSNHLKAPMRSAAKPFMVCPQIDLCDKCMIHLSDAQLSLMVSSHNGEAEHRNTVKSILELSNSEVIDLHCGTHLPFFNWLYDEYFFEKDLTKRQLFHNCSGKHAGMILLAMLIGSNKTDYWKIDHPVQQMITASVKDLLNISVHDIFSLALDGCGVPTYCITLKKMAQGYQQLYKDERLQPVVSAVMNEPYMIAGRDRIETDIIRHCGYFAKSGSDGIFCMSIPNSNISIALKIEDGNDDAAESAAVEILSILDLLTSDQEKLLDKYRHLKIYTSTGFLAGQLSPEWTN